MVGAGTSFIGLDADAERPCDLREASTADLWNDESRDAIEARFSQSALTYSNDTLTRVVPMIDTRMRRWEQAYETVCSGQTRSDDADAAFERIEAMALRERKQPRHHVLRRTFCVAAGGVAETDIVRFEIVEVDVIGADRRGGDELDCTVTQ